MITANPKYKDHASIKVFESWIRENYTGKVMADPPKDVDLNAVFYYAMDGLQYGPIPLIKIPKRFKVKQKDF